jgi:TRAP-type C4-dicarboxylate transport system substrate-binding protein
MRQQINLNRRVKMLLAAVSSMVVVTVSSAEADQVTWRSAHVVGGTHPFQTTAEFVQKRVGELTNGEFKIEIIGGGKLGDEVATMDLYKTGDIDMGFHYSASASTVIPEFGFLNFPFLFKDEAEWEAFMMRPEITTYWNEVAARHDPAFKVGAIGVFGTKGLYTRDIVIDGMDDITGLKFRVTPSPVLIEAWRSLGAEPIAMAYGEVYSAIQTGVLDGADNAPSGYNHGKHYEVAKNYHRTEHEVATVFLLVNNKSNDALSDANKKALDQALSEAQGDWVASSKSFAKRVEDQFGAWRVNEVLLSDELKGQIQAKVAPLRDEIAAKNNLGDFTAMLDAWRDAN